MAKTARAGTKFTARSRGSGSAKGASRRSGGAASRSPAPDVASSFTGASGDVRRKNMNIDQGQLDAVQALYGVSTETEAVALALGAAIDRVRFAREAVRGIARLAALGPLPFIGDRKDKLAFDGFAETPGADER